MKSYELITILGPTASGKTTFAAALAAQLDTEIISADSRQIYRSMDIGTGKDLADYNVNGKQIPYHLIDICEPGYKYNVFEYQHDFFRVYEDMKRRGKLPILCGGTGMYIEAVLKGYKLLDVPQNPELRESLRNKTLEELETILASYKILHNKTDVDTAQRAIRAIEIEEYYKTQAPDVNEYNPITLLLIAFFIFLCGFVADTLAMVVVLAPVFLPITNALGIHPIQLGILFVVCCETGFLTPPFGANLFITMKITDVKLEEVALKGFPYLLAMWLLIIVVAACPDFVMFLPRLLM